MAYLRRRLFPEVLGRVVTKLALEDPVELGIATKPGL
jgi:hypothetical protein